MGAYTSPTCFNLVKRPGRSALALTLFSTPSTSRKPERVFPTPKLHPKASLGGFGGQHKLFPKERVQKEVSLAWVLMSRWVGAAHQRVNKPPPSRTLPAPSLASSRTCCQGSSQAATAPLRAPLPLTPRRARGSFGEDTPVSRSPGAYRGGLTRAQSRPLPRPALKGTARRTLRREPAPRQGGAELPHRRPFPASQGNGGPRPCHDASQPVPHTLPRPEGVSPPLGEEPRGYSRVLGPPAPSEPG